MNVLKIICAILILLFIPACGSGIAATEPPVPSNTAIPSPAPTNTPLPPPTSTPIPPTPTPEFLQYYTEEFEKDLKYWPYFIINGRTSVIQNDPVEKVTMSAEGGFFKFDIEKTGFWVYSTYDPFDYEDVRIDARMDNLGTNDNYISLVCRYSKENGWYEFNIANSGLYTIYFAKPREDGYVNYAVIIDGGSNKIKQGLEVNEYTAICEGDNLSLFINGNLTKEVKDTQLTSGKVGISVSSFLNLPVKVNVDWIKISQP